MVVIVAYDASPILPAPLPLTVATVDAEALFDIDVSGSGAGADAILLSNRKKESPVNVWYAITSSHRI